MNLHSLRKTLGSIALALGLVACGDISEHDGAVPPEGSLVVAPPTRTISVAGPAGPTCTGVPTDFFPFHISTFDAAGRPRGNVDVDLILDFAPNTSTFAVMILLDDKLTPVTTTGSGVPFETTTDDEGNLTVYVFLELTAGCEYAGDLTIISGSIVQFAHIEVNAS